MHDPLSMNLKRQTLALLTKIPTDSPFAIEIQNATSRGALLSIVSRMLALPAYTVTVSDAFRPLLFDLCARWLHEEGNAEEQLSALALLLEAHEELYPIVSAFLGKPAFANGPLAYIGSEPASVDRIRLHRSLLAYVRILQANRELPQNLAWPLTPLSTLFWTPHPDTGVRILAIRCYALQTGMGEAEREKIEREVLGEVCGTDCQIEYGQDVQGMPREIDGWIMPVFEHKRVADARNALVLPHDYYTVEEGDVVEPLLPEELSPYVVNVHGILLLRSSGPTDISSPLIATPTAIVSLRTLATQLSLRLPTLLTSPPSSGKSMLLSHLAATLHPGVKNQIVTIHLADTSLDPRSLLGSYVSSTTQPGTFEWKEGVLVRAMREGKWVVFEDVDRGSSEVLGVIKPLVESMGLGKWIGGCARLEVPSRGLVDAHEGFALFATRSVLPSRAGRFPVAAFFGAHKFVEVIVPSPSSEELRTITDARFPRLAGNAAQCLIDLWEGVRALGSAASTRDVGLRELEKFCRRVENLLPSSYQPMNVDGTTTLSAIFSNPTLREDMYIEARDVFFGAGALTTSARAHADTIASTIAEHLGLEPDRQEWVLQGRIPDWSIEKDVNGRATAIRAGRTRLPARVTKNEMAPPITRPFAMHRPAILLLSRIATAVSLSEPVLLTGETGTGKTSVVTHLASLLRRPLISLNLSHQTESSDLLGGFKPVDARVPGSVLQEEFLELFGGTFSRRKNAKFEESVRKAVAEGKWKKAVGLWKESSRLAKDRIQAKHAGEAAIEDRDAKVDTPRKRQKVEDGALKVSEASWTSFVTSVEEFEVQHVQGKSKFAFGFVEGPLVKALRSGDWVLLDEVNLASPETLECISGLLHGPTASITLTEQGSLEPVPRHPDFRLFACMNPATDVGKKDLPPNIRSRFTEIDVPPPDADRETLIGIVEQYIGPSAVGDRGAILNVAEFYSAVKALAESRQLADGSNHRPHYSMRTLARALTFAADMAPTYTLRRAIWEGCLMAFTMVLNAASAAVVTALAHKHLLAGVRNPRAMLGRDPSVPQSRSADEFDKFGPFFLERGPLPDDPVDEYIMTPSVETKLVDLARIILTRRFPVLIEGPTSSGKTSSVEYLARKTGHRFIRINNHEHTDIQEYLGSYVSDPLTGKLVFKDGLLVRALRAGDWIVLDELNLAPTDVLEALNRLLDDNRELVIPETQEVVRPHPHFMLFATQNPPGLYAGRKVLSRAFRNRFLEVHFDDVPQAELETILCQRSQIAPSYGQKIVAVFQELQKRRQSGRVFESKHGFATLRDLFRWAGRDAMSYQELAENGYMLLAERARREDDKVAVKEVIESIMKVRIDESTMYNLQNPAIDFPTFLACPVPLSSQIIWTNAMQRLYILVSRALRFNEPVLLVGETGSGKTSICQVFAEAVVKHLHGLNCHQNTETADLIGGLRPVRNRTALEADALREVAALLEEVGAPVTDVRDEVLLASVEALLRTEELTQDVRVSLEGAKRKLQRLKAIFEWHDGPLVEAMRNGDVFLLDEISLADDSVLERLNSVLEPGRTLVLAERGGDDLEHPAVKADEDFKLVATMNPGGDYGKKELSPALRNRFTEIWVPAVDNRSDLELIVDNLWKFDALKAYTSGLIDFTEWMCTRVADRSLLSLRDILAWINFSNATYKEINGMPPNQIFHHAAHMTILDGLGSLPQLGAYTSDALARLKAEALLQLGQLVPLGDSEEFVPTHDPAEYVQFGSFGIPRGVGELSPHVFNLQAPTTRDNAMRVIRASQVPKPILLEGSPGVGKTSLVTALANISGNHLCRINLSDQTDLIDLFGSDLPVEGGGPGEFAWKDAEFLKALQEGHWVLLDEMNLAPQAVLEGLNAVLDHRGTVYIPELSRSFTRHPSFRIFAAQNPLHQGGGRKGLPKSFVNRFTKVYVEELSPSDLLLVCQHIFPQSDTEALRAMIAFNTRLNKEIAVNRSFGREGGPWEFNLRDVIRWGTLLSSASVEHPSEHLRSVYLQRFRTKKDREHARQLFDEVFTLSTSHLDSIPPPLVSSNHVQVGHFHAERKNGLCVGRPRIVLQSQLSALESVGLCVSQSWLVILSGSSGSGKTDVARTLAGLTGKALHEISVNSSTDTMDILGSFEQVDNRGRALAIIRDVLALVGSLQRTSEGAKLVLHDNTTTLRLALTSRTSSLELARVLHVASDVLSSLQGVNVDEKTRLQGRVQSLLDAQDSTGRFEWVDGPLITAIKKGRWLLMDGANLCNPSVLDRLNSLCEPDGVLTLSERGYVNGKVQVVRPHPNFRLFMSVDPQYGELSRAMRNRGMEIALLDPRSQEDAHRLRSYLRLPAVVSSEDSGAPEFDAARRGVLPNGSHTGTHSHPSTSGHVLADDAALSTLIAQMPVLSSSPSSAEASVGVLHAFIRVATPAYFPHLLRFLAALESKNSAAFTHVLKTLQAASEQNFAVALSSLRNKYNSSRGLQSPLSSIQPLDTYLSIPPAFNSSELPHMQILQILSLFVVLVIDDEETATSRQALVSGLEKQLRAASSSGSGGKQLPLKEIEIVLAAVSTVAHSILDVCDGEAPDTSNATLAVKLVGYSQRLRQVALGSTFDFSAVLAISSWLVEALKGSTDAFSVVAAAARALERAVSLSAGLALNEIWFALLLERALSFSSPKLLELELMACGPHQTGALRNEVFQLMALQTLPGTPSQQELASLEALARDVETRFVNADREEVIALEDPSSVIAELKTISRVPAIPEASLPLNTRESIVEIIASTCNDPNASMRRLVPFQHLLWALDANTRSLPTIVESQVQWMHALWSARFIDKDALGPLMLLQPTQLAATMRICDWSRNSMLSLKEYEESVRRHTRVTLLHSDSANSRVAQLTAMMQQMILSITSCFSTSFPSDVLSNLRELSSASSLGQGSSVVVLLGLLDQTSHAPFKNAYSRQLRPALERLGETTESRGLGLVNLGRAWIGFSRMLTELYVPDAPIDPAATQQCAADMWRREEVILVTQYDVHLQLEQRSTGNTTNVVLAYLQSRLEDVRKELAQSAASPVRERGEVSRLHMFWSEVAQFQTQVVFPAKVDSLVALLESSDPTGELREQVTQESISGFLQRLHTAYPEYEDIIGPYKMALLATRVGLRLCAHSGVLNSNMSSDALAQLSIAAVSFPSVHSSSLLRSAAPVSGGIPGVTAFKHLVLNIAGLALERALGVGFNCHLQSLQDAYGQAIGLWLIDRARESDMDEAAATLYRRKLDYEAVGDSEIEEREFLELFPNFENVLDLGQEAGMSTAPDQAVPLLVDASQTQQLANLHLTLMDMPGFSSAFSMFDEVRRSMLDSLLQSQLKALPDVLDSDGLPLQLALLQGRLLGLQDEPLSTGASYNFYLDANAVEIRKAAKVVLTLRTRLEELVLEWSDQMVLHNLKSRCDDVLALNVQSPVAKVLSALEQLLVQTADWEIFANKENSLKAYQHTLTELIVEWRRFELSCWQGLLGAQARSFAADASDWWFRLYDAIVRGSLDSNEREQTGGPETVTIYLAKLIPLLDEYVRLSPLGQFHSRMELLRSFQVFVGRLALAGPVHQRSSMLRVQHVVEGTISHWNLFATQIATHLATQRAILEKEIRAFIKLASWKDINVHALKASATRTHHQLYKIIRKFREVMRQPITDRLQPELAGDAESKYLEAEVVESHVSAVVDVQFPVAQSTSEHLKDLGRTFRQFGKLAGGPVSSFIHARTATVVDNLAVDIITSSKELAALTVPKDIATEKREKYEKTLLVRKRKAYSDLLKELKRCGFAVNVKPDVLLQQSDACWVREQPSLMSAQGTLSVSKAETYFNRLQWALPELRATVSDHHADLSTRELQRGITLLESTLTMCLEARTTLSNSCSDFSKLQRLSNRLKQLSSEPHIVVSGAATTAVSSLGNTLCQLVSALQEMVRGIDTFNALSVTTKVPVSVSSESQSLLATSISLRDNVVRITSDVDLTEFSILLKAEQVVLQQAVEHIQATAPQLQNWMEGTPSLRHLLHPILVWLTGQSPASFQGNVPSEDAGIATDAVVETILVSMQNILAACSVKISDEPLDERKHYLRTEYRLMRDVTRAMDIDVVHGRTSQALQALTQCSSSVVTVTLDRFLPFLDRYMAVVEEQLTVHAQWTKALFKLAYILCTVAQTVAKQGFCKAPESEGSGEGETSESTGGVGLGEGSGTENVSKEIEDESQVEGLQGDNDENNDPRDQDEGDDDAIEMAEDFGGDLEDVPEEGSGEEDNNDDKEDEQDPDEQLGKLDATDPSAVDEKLWGDEQGPTDENDTDEKVDEDRSEEQTKDSEVVAKEGKQSQGKDEKKKDGQEKDEESAENEAPPEDETMQEECEENDEAGEEQPDAGGAPVDDYLKDANTLDLPDDMDLGPDDNMPEDPQGGEDEDDDMDMDDAVPEDLPEALEDQRDERSPSPTSPDQMDDSPPDGPVQSTGEDADAPEDDKENEEDPQESAVAQPDVSTGDDASAPNEPENPDMGESAAAGQTGTSEGNAGKDTGAQEQVTDQDGLPETDQLQRDNQNPDSQAAGSAAMGSQQGQAPSQPDKSLSSNPLRSLGDALKEIRKRFDDIQTPEENPEASPDHPMGTTEAAEVEYLRPDDADQDMQALGPAGEEQVAKLNELRILDDDAQATEDNTAMDVDEPQSAEVHERSSQNAAQQAEKTSRTADSDVEGAVTQVDLDGRQAPSDPELALPKADVEMAEEALEVEAELRSWQAEGLPEEGAEHIWRLYESLTHDLAYALCEQLRLILEPTLATRLKGDYRTGKRLNMKKIISYIASDYTKDKIWLRRTRPSQREYQVLIALDDSRSMAESHSVHLAYETMALVSKALSRLEAGDIAIAKFGEAVEMLHGFDEGPFTDQAGTKVMNAFKFDQKATNVLSLVERSLRVLELARERRSMSSSTAADLWQLEIIISDGICQDHDKLRTVMRKAEEQRVMIVFIVIDSLHSAATAATGGSASTSAAAVHTTSAIQNSILSMNQVAYKNVDGRMELQMERYLDSFPFEYYVVLRSVEALPEVLSGTLKQFFERISEE